MAAELPASPPDRHGDLATTLSALAGEGVDRDLLDRFVRILLAGFEPDGESPLAPGELARLASEAFAFYRQRPGGLSRLGWRRIDPTGGQGRGLTLIEILNDDMPFLVSSVMGELQARGLSSRLALHPILTVTRDQTGQLESIASPSDGAEPAGRRESFIWLAFDALEEADARLLVASLDTVLRDVRAAVGDWRSMLTRLDAAISALEAAPDSVPRDLLLETLDFCRWLRDGQFTFLGMREYALRGPADIGELEEVSGSGLGILRDPAIHVLRRGSELVAMTPEVRRFYFAPQPMIITKSNVVSRVHRRAHMDYIGIKTYRPDGALAGELRIVGLFTARAYTAPPQQIPFLRLKVRRVLAISGLQPASHAYRVLQNILDTFPRDELIQIGVRQLASWAPALLDLELRPRLRVFVRTDRFDRFVSVLVYMPRDGYTTRARETISAILSEAFNGRISAYQPFFTAGPLVRVHFIVGRYEGETPQVAAAELERRIREATRSWQDRLHAEILARDPAATPLVKRYGHAFSAGYAESFPPRRALEDIDRIERLGPERPQAIDFYTDSGRPRRVRAAIYRYDAPIPLSERVPILENLGFKVIDERTYLLTPGVDGGIRRVCLHDMALESASGEDIDISANEARLEDAFLAVFRGAAENDTFNRLVLWAAATWREAAVMRALAGYMRQIRSPFGLRYVADTLAAHPVMARDLIELFRIRFDPDRIGDANARAAEEAALRARFEAALAAVESLDEDRILRQLASLIAATKRTNFYQTSREGAPDAIAFKLASREIDGAPEPRPYREIWVSSPRVDGIHLRFAPIARGGLRWSDRPQDVRTEVLGLARAQQVKNTVIVPQGAKGGFVPKQLPRTGTREEVINEGVAAYRTFVATLLDLTDNLDGSTVEPPPRLLRYDEDDPYLVVAADKGTATFSDIANEISGAHGFWLGDAFASGGSAGYDHKRMGITARGAWECVKRHFREMDHDISIEPFSVVGVGDMTGDVFGNGMLLSRAIRLVAAFDHRDIFLDPDPDPEASFAERQRLFALPRSSWQDYDRDRISQGGGVYSRSAKSIPLSDEVRARLGVSRAQLTPNELIQAILETKVDLAWFGGIGTYVKAAGETDEQVGDRANDAVRILAARLGARVVGEGANLALTQRARIAFARAGGRINTDFIDNSAGVNSSDQEVNIKIALGPVEARGALDREGRNALLASMTDDVASACLANNHQQSLALSLAEREGASGLSAVSALMRHLEARGLLSRKLEALPDDAELAERAAAGSGLTRPELAVLLGYAKIALSYDLIASPVPDSPAMTPLLLGYFPERLARTFGGDLLAHRLRREIITTELTNDIVNRGGLAFAVTLMEETGRPVADVARAFIAAQEVFGVVETWQAIGALDGRIPGSSQLALYAEVARLLRSRTAWFAHEGAMDHDLETTIRHHCRVMTDLRAALPALASPERLHSLGLAIDGYLAHGAPRALAETLATTAALVESPNIARVVELTGRHVAEAAALYLAVTDHLDLEPLKRRGEGLIVGDRYEKMAIDRAMRAIAQGQRALAVEALGAGARAPDLSAWLSAPRAALAQTRHVIPDILDPGDMSAPRLTVAAAEISRLARVA